MANRTVQQQFTQLATKCGCGGDISPGEGCLKYLTSEGFASDENGESMRRGAGLGFGSSVYDSSEAAIMSLHLQQNGFTPEEAEVTLLG